MNLQTVKITLRDDNIPTAAVGDVHGQAGQLRTLLDEIERRFRDTGGRIVLLGDLVDRGRHSREAVETAMTGSGSEGIEYVTLAGNHEAMAIAAYDEPSGETMRRWLRSGGIDTLVSYGLDDEDKMFDGRWKEFMPAEHMEFLRGLPDVLVDGNRIYVHAGLRPGVPLDLQNRHDAHWIREEFLGTDFDFGAMVVHGHTIERQPSVRPFRIGIDTGAHYHGTMTAAVFLDGETFYLQASRGQKRSDPVTLSEWDPQITAPVP